jgi:hypothetical protein
MLEAIVQSARSAASETLIIFDFDFDFFHSWIPLVGFVIGHSALGGAEMCRRQRTRWGIAEANLGWGLRLRLGLRLGLRL